MLNNPVFVRFFSLQKALSTGTNLSADALANLQGVLAGVTDDADKQRDMMESRVALLNEVWGKKHPHTFSPVKRNGINKLPSTAGGRVHQD